MKHLMKILVMNACAVTSLIAANSVFAHSVGGSLGAAAGTTDVYAVTCSNEDGGTTPSFRLSARVKDNSPVAAPVVKVTIAKAGATASVTDVKDGDTTYSPWARVAKNNGLYTMSVSKSAAGTESYTVQFHCEGPLSSGYIHTGTTSQQTQNQ